ncbi:MAG: methyltransferase domain-containing protein [Ilumatobacteraceae bacterium]
MSLAARISAIPPQLRSFRRRRITIPVDHTSLVLDVGSGDKPHWRADVLLDRYVGDDHGGQRSGAAAARVDRPLFDADAADMPFADKVFDYVICSHMLEHVEHPAAVVAELTRVAKAGYIEVPEAASAKIVDFPSHLWWVTMENGVIVFTAKTVPYFDADIDRYLTASGMRQPIADLLDKHLDHRVIELPWTGTVGCRVVGSPPAGLIAAAHSADAHHRSSETVAGRALTAALALPQRSRRHRGPIFYDDIIRDDRRTGTGEALTAKIYR